LGAASPDEIRQATESLRAALATVDNLDNTRLDPDTSPAPEFLRRIVPGNGNDESGVCMQSGLARRHWFPLRSFVPPVKDQGRRGTCWAFAAVASVESRERVQNNNSINLSEQFLVNKVKYEWFPSELVDGGSSMDALNAAVARNMPLPTETSWTYNQAWNRPKNAFDPGVIGTLNSYSGTCFGYSGTCSWSAHESPRDCTQVGDTVYCGYDKVNDAISGISASPAKQIWSNGQPFDLESYRALLARGVSMMASFPTYVGFTEVDGTGIVSDYRKQRRDAMGNLVDGDAGGHMVQVVGFISNEELTFPGTPPSTVGGGGYFVIRNSWGCTADGGYYYIPADYVSKLFWTLEALDFDGRRSEGWKADQVAPGGAAGLAIDPMGRLDVALRVQKNLAPEIAISHPVANYVRLKVTSNLDGVLFDGQWLVNQPVGGSLFNNSLPVTFQSEGERTLTITATYGSQVVKATKTILVRNSAPAIRFESRGTPQEGESFAIDAVVTDINEPDPAGICSTMQWTLNPADAIVSGSGCSRVVRFGPAGRHEITVTARDREGLAVSATGAFEVAPPPANPFPRIDSFGLSSRDQLLLNGKPSGCWSNAVPNNTKIDLRQAGCTALVAGGADVSRYFATLGIENRDGEALTYDWTYTINPEVAGVLPLTFATKTTKPSFDFAPVRFGFHDTAYTCSLDVKVNAPDPSRSKAVRVWSGKCINLEDVLH
jgi:hypothetical protein